MHEGSISGFVWQFPAVVDGVEDGDSVVCTVWWRPPGTPGAKGHDEGIRIEGINAIEKSQKFGIEARGYLAELLPIGTRVTLVARKREKFGRFLARIITESGVDISNEMLTALASDGLTHLAVPYKG